MDFFEERQKFNQIWIWVLLFGSTLTALIPISIGLYNQLVLGEPFGNKPMSDTGFIIFFVFILFILLGVNTLIYSMKLETRIDRVGFHYKFFPFVLNWKSIRKEDIDQFEVKTYNALTDFGGWGYRFNFSGVKAMNIRGNAGMKIITKGQRIMFGTQKPAELKRAMDKLMNPASEEF